ncbi:phospholipid carrier-dependent glycosyltransferase [Chloroflexota bacterium]
MLFSTAVALLVFYWSCSLYGVVPGLFSIAIYILDPNIIAQSRLITTDIYAVGIITLAAFSLWRFSIRRDIQHAVLSAATLGWAQLTK